MVAFKIIIVNVNIHIKLWKTIIESKTVVELINKFH